MILKIRKKKKIKKKERKVLDKYQMSLLLTNSHLSSIYHGIVLFLRGGCFPAIVYTFQIENLSFYNCDNKCTYAPMFSNSGRFSES